MRDPDISSAPGKIVVCFAAHRRFLKNLYDLVFTSRADPLTLADAIHFLLILIRLAHARVSVVRMEATN
jgi:hypothetical protein